MNRNLFACLLAAISILIVQPAAAQQAPPRWNPGVETITVTAMAAAKNLRAVLTGTHFAEAFAVSASIPVPYPACSKAAASVGPYPQIPRSASCGKCRQPRSIMHHTNPV